MNNQKNSAYFQQDFIRKPRRRISPKQKNENLYQFKCPHKENINSNAKEEYHLNQNQSPVSDTKIVYDLKLQLSHLKEQVAKIAHSKIQTVNTENDTSKLKMLDYYSNQNHSKKLHLSPKNIKDQINACEVNDPSLEKDSKMLKSKERLKFSKLKKVDKLSPMTSTKKKPQNASGKSIQSEQLIKQQQEEVRKKSIDESTLEEQIKKIGTEHRNKLQAKICSFLLEQDNMSINNQQQVLIKESKQSSCSLGIKTKQILSPGGQTTGGSLQSRLIKMRRQLQQKQNEIGGLKLVIKQKTERISNLQRTLKQTQQRIDKLNVQIQTNYNKLVDLQNQKLTLLEQKIKSQQNTSKLQITFNEIEQTNTKLTKQLQKVNNQLQSRQLQVIKLEKLNKNLINQIENLKNQNLKILENAKKQHTLKQNALLEEITKNQKIIKELKTNYKPKSISIHQNQTSSSTIKLPKQELSAITNVPTSPRANNGHTAKQKQLLNVIRMHQKSLQNYQKDLAFLESECKNLHQFKALSKKQQTLIFEANQALIEQQLAKLNAKYQKKLLTLTTQTKQLPRKVSKQRIPIRNH